MLTYLTVKIVMVSVLSFQCWVSSCDNVLPFWTLNWLSLSPCESVFCFVFTIVHLLKPIWWIKVWLGGLVLMVWLGGLVLNANSDVQGCENVQTSSSEDSWWELYWRNYTFKCHPLKRVPEIISFVETLYRELGIALALYRAFEEQNSLWIPLSSNVLRIKIVVSSMLRFWACHLFPLQKAGEHMRNHINCS